jgi:hypothetical protein
MNYNDRVNPNSEFLDRILLILYARFFFQILIQFVHTYWVQTFCAALTVGYEEDLLGATYFYYNSGLIEIT